MKKRSLETTEGADGGQHQAHAGARPVPPGRSLMPEMDIRSPRHPLVAVIADYRRPGSRRLAGVCIAEGPHLVDEALAAGLRPVTAVVTGRYAASAAGAARMARLSVPPASLRGGVWTATDRAFAAISAVPAPQGILAVFQVAAEPPADPGIAPYTLALDAVQDPGNVGALARVLLAFCGAGALLLCGPGTADPFGEKALRASAGAMFHLRTRFVEDLPGGLRAMAVEGTRWWALCARGGVCVRRADLSRPLGLVVGNEGRGVSREVLALCGPVTVPMPGPAESLNAAVAGGVVLYEAAMRGIESGAGHGTPLA